MARVLVISFNNTTDAIIMTSIVRTLVNNNHTVIFAGDYESAKMLSYSPCSAIPITSSMPEHDMVINLSPSSLCSKITSSSPASAKFGYGSVNDELVFLNDGAKKHYECRYLHWTTDSSLIQLSYACAGLTWKGEGYDIKYYPKYKSQKSLLGLAIKNLRLKHFVKNNLDADTLQMCEIPLKNNLLQQIDEINRCKQIITDDEGILHISISLRKHTQYLIDHEPTYRMEMFGSGSTHVYDPDII